MLGGNRKRIPSDYVCDQPMVFSEAFSPAKPQFIHHNYGGVTSQHIAREVQM